MNAAIIPQQYQDIQSDHLRPSTVQPRKRFNEFKLTELAKSIQAQGILQPILVRPLEVVDSVQYFEIVAGERRWRAGRMAGQVMLPCRVKAMTDVEAIEIAVIENDQREDLHPLEQAGGYAQLLKAYGHEHATQQNVDELAIKIGKSKGFVYARLKLLELIPDAQDLFYDGTMNASVALRFARMTHTAQGKLLKRWLELSQPGEPLSVIKTEKLIQKEFMLRLDKAPFPVADVTLVPAAGACGACPKRTGCAPDFFDDVEEQDTCTDVACFDTKSAAQGQRRKDAARAQGLEVFEGDTARTLLKFGENSAQLGGEYVYMDEPLEALTGSTTPVAKLLGTHLAPSALFEHPREKTLREIVHVVKATNTLREQGLLIKPPTSSPAARPSPAPSGTSKAGKIERPEREPAASTGPTTPAGEEFVKANQFHENWRVATFREYHRGLHGIGYGMPSVVHRMVALELALTMLDDADSMALMAELWGWTLPAWPLGGLRGTMGPILAEMNDDELDLLIAELVVLPDLWCTPAEIDAWKPGTSMLEIAASSPELEVDVPKLIAKAKKAVYGKPKAPKKAAGAKTQSTPRISLPPAGDDKGAPANVAGKPDHEEDTSQQAQGPEGDDGDVVLATFAAAGQRGEEQQAQGPGDDDGAEASINDASGTTSAVAGAEAQRVSAWPFPLTDTKFCTEHWSGQKVRLKATKAIGEVRDVVDGIFKIAVPSKSDPARDDHHQLAMSEFIVLPGQVHPVTGERA